MTTAHTNNNKGQVLTQTNPKRQTTRYEYDDNGELEMIAEPGGKITRNTYYPDGTLHTMGVCGQPPTEYTYWPDGNIRTETNPDGAVTEYTYFEGRIETETKTRTTEDEAGNPITVTMTPMYEYDSVGRQTKSVDPYLYEEITHYNQIGEKDYTIDKNQVRTDYEYDANGKLEYVRYADGTFEHHAYDEEGNKTESVDRTGKITGYGYDALNRLTDTWHCGEAETCTADNAVHVSSTEYDGMGRVIAQIEDNLVSDETDGRRTEFDYDDAGRRATVRRFLGGRVIETRFTYDDNGNQKTVTDPDNHTVTHEYDEANRMVKTIFHDTSYTEYEYNGLGQKVLEYSQILPGNEADRIKTKFDYDHNGRLVKVTNDFEGPDRIETSYEYDEVGNKVIKQIDPNNHVTKWVYDHLGRVTKRTLPEGQFEKFTYYPNGTIDTKTDFNGDIIDHTYYPCCGRLHRRTYEDSTYEEYTYTGTGRIDTFRNRLGEVTDSDYDFRGRLTHISRPDGTYMNYTYYPNGTRHTVSTPTQSTTHTYDDLNRLETVTVDGKQTVYTYYDSGLRNTVTYSNGTVATYGYDTLNRLKTIENRKSDGEHS